MVRARAAAQWCLFLDRDGVLNREVSGDYVRRWDQFQWLPSALPALQVLRQWAPRVVVITNQQGVGKGLMTAEAVSVIHERMHRDLNLVGVELDAVLVCPHLASAGCLCRKPGAGLALEWLREHPGVDASLSIMVGDKPTDLQMARNLAAVVGDCAAVRIGEPGADDMWAASFRSLSDFAAAVQGAGGRQI